MISYENFGNFEVRKTEPSSINKIKKKIENEEFEKQIIQDLDNWDHNKHNISKKPEEKETNKKKSNKNQIATEKKAEKKTTKTKYKK